jgi:predicted PurR-regulated permease PerM
MAARRGAGPVKDIRLERYREFQRRQREALRTSHQLAAARRGAPGAESDGEAGRPEHPGDSGAPPTAGDLGADGLGAGAPGLGPASSAGASRFGSAGRPLNRHSPFYVGFVGAIGVMLAIGLWQMAGKLTSTLTILLVALFLTLALNPLVEWLCARGLRRAAAVGMVFAGLLVVFGLLGSLVIPPVVSEGAALVANAPEYVDTILGSAWAQRLDENYDVIDKLQSEINARLSDADFLGRVFGGALGAGKALANGLFQTFTILILTLYFLASLPTVKRAAYAMLPATRRPRVEPLSEEIMRRTGAYAIGQVTVATINALASYVMMRIVGIPYAAVLAVVVGFLGLIPMVGATIGAVLVCLVAFFDSPSSTIIAGIYYLIYQQVENYFIAPKIMARTVAVPGAVTVVAALAGGSLLGVLGALLAIPVAAGLLLLYEEVLVPRQQRA